MVLKRACRTCPFLKRPFSPIEVPGQLRHIFNTSCNEGDLLGLRPCLLALAPFLGIAHFSTIESYSVTSLPKLGVPKVAIAEKSQRFRIAKCKSQVLQYVSLKNHLPNLLFLAFLDFLTLCLFKEFLACVFLFFPIGFQWLGKTNKNPCFFWRFSLPFSFSLKRKQGQKIRAENHRKYRRIIATAFGVRTTVQRSSFSKSQHSRETKPPSPTPLNLGDVKHSCADVCSQRICPKQK